MILVINTIVKENTNTGKSNTMNYVAFRKKSSKLGVVLNHQLNPISHCRINH